MSDAERLAERLEARIEYPTQDRNSTVMWLDKDGKPWTANTGKITQLVNPDGPEAATLLRAQSARIAALEDALRAIEEGTIERPILWTYREDGKPSKHDRCIHEARMWETCAGCIDAHIAKALGKGSE